MKIRSQERLPSVNLREYKLGTTNKHFSTLTLVQNLNNFNMKLEKLRVY